MDQLLFDRILAKRLPDREVDSHTWLLLDLLFYLANLWANPRLSCYDLAVLGGLDAFLFLAKDERQKLQLFHNLPKLFLLHLRSPPLLNLLALGLVALHVSQQLRANKSVLFFAGVTLFVFFAALGTTKIIALSFVTGIMASYLYLWEAIEPNSKTLAADENNLKAVEDNSTQDENQFKDQAIAQEIVSKLKKLKVAMIIEQERHKKSGQHKKEKENPKQQQRRGNNMRRGRSVLAGYG